MSFNPHVFPCEVCPHFTGGEIDAQRAEVLCPGLHLQGKVGLGFFLFVCF